MNRIAVERSRNWNFAHLYPLGDFHIGSANFNESDFERLINIIETDEHAVVVLNGDIINNATKTSVSDIYRETMSPEQSIEVAVEYLERIKDKIIGVTTGNHEERTYRLTGLDPTKHICYRLGIDELYDPVSNVIFLSFGKNRGRQNVYNTFVLYQTHGRGGGRTIGSKANNVARLANIIHADVYIHSHTHVPITFKQNYFMTNASNKGMKQVKRLFVNTNAYEGFGGYGERASYTPTNNDFILVKLSADRNGNKEMSADL
jgi:predicted phosphodiesterase